MKKPTIKNPKAFKAPKPSRDARVTRAMVRNASYTHTARSGSLWGV